MPSVGKDGSLPFERQLNKVIHSGSGKHSTNLVETNALAYFDTASGTNKDI
jgi:hypothetical protein